VNTINVFVKTKAKKNEVTVKDDVTYVVAVTAAPEKGQANAAVIKLLAKFLNISPAQLVIVSGETSKYKVIVVS
jgi:uncharacterized protein